MEDNSSKISSASSYKLSLLTNEDVIDAVITLPPDGGWGWAVVVAAFLCNFVADGSIYTFGVFLEDISKTFKVPSTTVAIGNSLMTGFYYSSGPITCALVNRWGFQITGFVGGAIAACAFYFSSLQTHIHGFLIIFGAIGGFGFGLVYVPSIVVIGFYFEKWRALATSIAVTGSAAGIMGFPYIIEGILQQYHWRTKFKIIAGGCLITSFLALMYLPLKPVRVSIADKKAMDYFTDLEAQVQKEKPGFFKRIFHRFHNVTYPTAAEVHKDSTIVISIAETSSSSSTLLNASGLEASASILVKTTGSRLDGDASKTDRLSTVYEMENSKSYKCKKWCKKACVCRKCLYWGPKNRPMYRDDIFFTGSVYKLPEYSQAGLAQAASHSRTPPRQTKKPLSRRQLKSEPLRNLEYNMSVTRAAVREKDLEKTHCACCHESILRTLVTMLNFSLLKSPSFVLLALSGFFSLLGMYVPFVYLIQRAHEIGMESHLSLHLFTALGASNALGRIFSGIVSTIPQANALLVSCISILICGIATNASYFIRSTIGQYIYTSFFGLTIAALASLRAPIVVDMLGLENLTNAFGIILLFQGIAAFTGIPLAGQIVTLSKSYNAAYIFSGSVITFSALMLIPLKRISNWEKRRQNTNYWE